LGGRSVPIDVLALQDAWLVEQVLVVGLAARHAWPDRSERAGPEANLNELASQLGRRAESD